MMAPDTLPVPPMAPVLTPVLAPVLAEAPVRRRYDRVAVLRIMGLATAEIVALVLGAVAVTSFSPGSPAGVLAGAGIVVVGVRAVIGLLPGHGLHPHEILRRSVVATVIALVTSAGLPTLQGQSGHIFIVTEFLLIALPLQYLGRNLAIRLLHSVGLWAIPVHVIGETHLRQRVESFFRHNMSYGLAPDDSRPASVALVTDGGWAGTADLSARYRQVILLADIPQLRISGLQPAGVRGSVGLHLPRGQAAATGAWLKRALDLAIAVPMMVVVAPVIAVAAAAIWIVDPGPVFYTQLREGLHGRPLRVLKLRTMYCDAEGALQTLLRSDPAALAEWTTHFKLKRDPRILPGIGRLLRRSSCDELPQLLNVIAGGMSLVGPRPFPDYHLAAMRPEFRRKRCSVLPGITGLWQISDRSEADVERQEQLDDFYIDNRSVWLDLSILLRTIPAVLLGRGAC